MRRVILVPSVLFLGLCCVVSLDADDRGAGAPETLVAGDANCDGRVDLGDAVHVLVYLYLAGDPPCAHADRPDLLAQLEAIEAQAASLSTQLASCEGELTAARERIRTLEVHGCMNERAENFNPRANVDDGSCVILGCTDPDALNFDPTATSDDGSCFFSSDSPARIHRYSASLLEPPAAQFFHGEARRISNAGHIIGQYHGFWSVVWEPDGTPTVLSCDGVFNALIVFAVNDDGVIAGQCATSPVRINQDRSVDFFRNITAQRAGMDINNEGIIVVRGFGGLILPNGSIGDVQVPPGVGHELVAINNRNQVAGVTFSGNVETPAIWSQSGSIHLLPVPFPFVSGRAIDLNDNGMVVGQVQNNFIAIAVAWHTEEADRIVELVPEPGRGFNTYPLGVNNHGVVLISGGFRGPHLYADGVFASVRDLIENPEVLIAGFELSDINDSGVLVGRANVGSTASAPVMLTPTPRFFFPAK